jgi:hypothetical protein
MIYALNLVMRQKKISLTSCEILDELRQLGITNASEIFYYFGDYAVYCSLCYSERRKD